jgi:two-component system cell cycle sensor histidine kinase/response regulator CckA
VIRIMDQGIGIPEENLTKIFDPYFTTRNSGNGLGLTSVYSIITKHDGHVAVESTAGNGTTFHLYLPALHGTCPKETELTELSENRRGKGRILILDDEILVRHTARDMLEHLGYEVDLCEDGSTKPVPESDGIGTPVYRGFHGSDHFRNLRNSVFRQAVRDAPTA